MKRKCVFAKILLCCLYGIKSFAQNDDYYFIPSMHLDIAYFKTTNLIFPFPVQGIDKGSKDVLVQQAEGTENIVQIKADKPNFTQTNLSVITNDGRLYSFILDYDSLPAQLNIIVANNTQYVANAITYKQNVLFSSQRNEGLYKAVSQKITSLKLERLKRNKHNQMELQLDGVYIDHDIFYFRFLLKNSSNIRFNLDAIKFTIKDKQKSKRTAIQEKEITPLYSFGNLTDVVGNSSSCGVIAIPKFTLADSKYLWIQVLEKDGGRSLHLKLKGSYIMKAKKLDDFM